MKNTELLRRIIACKAVRPSDHPLDMGFYIDDNRICGDPSLMAAVGEALALEISDATSDGRGMPSPDFMVATGVKSAALAHHAARGLEPLGIAGVGFRWFSYGGTTGRKGLVPEYPEAAKEEKKAIMVKSRIGFDDKVRGMIWDARQRGIEIIGVACAFNSDDIAPSQLGVPIVLSLFKRAEIERCLKDAQTAISA